MGGRVLLCKLIRRLSSLSSSGNWKRSVTISSTVRAKSELNRLAPPPGSPDQFILLPARSDSQSSIKNSNRQAETTAGVSVGYKGENETSHER